MSVKFKIYRNERKHSSTYGKFYARAVVSDVADLETISREIEENTSAKQADVYAVLKELVNAMGRHLRNGDRIVLDGFGSFKVGLRSKPADTEKAFNAGQHIVGMHINFQPETHWKGGDRTRTRAFLSGIEFKPFISKEYEIKMKKDEKKPKPSQDRAGG